MRSFGPISYRFLKGIGGVTSNNARLALYPAASVAISAVRRKQVPEIGRPGWSRDLTGNFGQSCKRSFNCRPKAVPEPAQRLRVPYQIAPAIGIRRFA